MAKKIISSEQLQLALNEFKEKTDLRYATKDELDDKQDTITDGSATIASVSSDIVTLKAGVAQSNGAISNSSGNNITLSKVAKTGSYNDLGDKPTIPTITFVDWS